MHNLSSAKTFKGRRTRAVLVGIARKAFAARGYGAVAVADLTAAEGLTKGSVYHYFGAKEDLFRAVVDEVLAEIAARIAAVSEGPAPIWSRLRAAYLAWFDSMATPEAVMLLQRDAPQVLGSAEVAALVQRHVDTVIAPLWTEALAGRLTTTLRPAALSALMAGAAERAADPNTGQELRRTFLELLEMIRSQHAKT